MKKSVFLVVLAIAACLSAQISVNHPDDIPDFIQVEVNEASNMVFTGEPNYKGNNLGDFNEGFICDNNQYQRAYWKVGDSALVNGPNDPNYEPQLRGDGSLVLVFRLPVKGGAEKVVAAHLFTYVGWISGTESVDLYGLRTVRAEDVNNTDPNKAVMVKQSDYFVGSFGCDPNATPIQTEYIQMPYSASVNKWHITGYDDDTNGPDRLRCWLQKQYDEGAEGGDYVLLRLTAGGYRSQSRQAVAGYLDSYHQIQISTMWTNPNFKADVNDVNDMNSIPLTRLTKNFSNAPRLFIQFTTGTPAACPGPLVYCCAALPGDITGNCHVDTNDLKIMADSWLEAITVNDANLLSRYSFDGSGSANWANSIADACSATPKGNAKTAADPERGRAADLSSSTSWLWVGFDPVFNRRAADANDANDANGITTQITVAAWVKTGDTTMQRIAGRGYAWYIDTNSTTAIPYFVVRHTVDTNALNLLGTITVGDNEWHHVAGTYDAVSGVQKLYIDGVLDACSTHHAAEGINQYDVYCIGARVKYSDANTWDPCVPGYTGPKGIIKGWVDEVRIYNRALPAEDIAGLASWGLPADVTKNGIVNFRDFAALAEDWLECALFPNPATECLK